MDEQSETKTGTANRETTEEAESSEVQSNSNDTIEANVEVPIQNPVPVLNEDKRDQDPEFVVQSGNKSEDEDEEFTYCKPKRQAPLYKKRKDVVCKTILRKCR